MSVSHTIFVQVPAYRDRELIPTLVDLIEKAECPDALHIAVCWQHGSEFQLRDFEVCGLQLINSVIESSRSTHCLEFGGADICIMEFDYTASEGCGWARAMTQTRYRGEDYALQMDSHHRFVDGWDGELIRMLESLRSQSPWPVLTGYPLGYRPGYHIDFNTDVALQMEFGGFGGDGLILYKSNPIVGAEARTAPIRARFFSGGFCFSDGHFVEHVPYDASHFFASEEISMAVRAFTNGYDLYHPHRNVIWHYYSRDSEPKIWGDHSKEAVTKGIIKEDAETRARIARDLIEMQFGLRDASGHKGGPHFEFGSVRSLLAYEQYAGISFKHRAVTQDTLDGKEPVFIRNDGDDLYWESRLIRKTDITVKMDHLDKFFGEIAPNTCLIRVVGANGQVVSTHTASEQELVKLREAGKLLANISVNTDLSSIPELCMVSVFDSNDDLLIKTSFYFDN